MNLSDSLRTELEKELRFVSDKIIAEKDVMRKVFYYSAAYGVTRRIMNLSYDSQLSFMHLILEASYRQINDRVNQIVRGRDATIPLISDFFEKLSEEVLNLAESVKNDQDTYKILERIVTLAFLTTGNGYYLYVKGQIKI
jgi:hypothetical protein